MGRPLGVTRTDIDRALKAAADAGYKVSELLIEPRKVRVILGTVAAGPEKVNAGAPKDWPTGE